MKIPLGSIIIIIYKKDEKYGYPSVLRSVIIHPFSILNSVNLDVDRKISSKIIRIYTFLDITKWESW